MKSSMCNRAARCLFLLIVLAQLSPAVARAGVLQVVFVEQSTNGVQATTDSEEIFGATSADVTNNILAQIGAFPALGFRAVSSASQFGSVGLSGIVFPRGIEVGAGVFVASDEFVNVTGVPQRATASFVIDGGSLFIEAGRDVRASYELSLVVWNLGSAPLETDRADFGFIVFTAPSFPIPTARFDTAGALEADASGNLAFILNPGPPGEDIGAVFDPLTGRVEIPLSLQSLDLGIIAPGDRLYLEYTLGITAGGLGVSESTIARFSDPFNLSGNGLLGRITLQPVSAVAGPSTLLLLAVGMIGALAGRRRSSSVTHHPSPGAT